MLRLVLLTTLLLAPLPALAHPHVWVDAASEIVFDDDAQIVAIRHYWRFDEAFSAYASQGLDADGDGEVSGDELQPLAEVNVESLAEYEYFTRLSTGDYVAGFSDPTDYHLEWIGDRLLLQFTLPLARPLATSAAVTLEVYDPEYFVSFTRPSHEAVRLAGAPDRCSLGVQLAEAPDAATAAALAAVGADQRELPDDLKSLTEGLDNSATVHCP